MPKNKPNTHTKEFSRFSAAMDKILKVSHSDMKAMLEAEKRAKKERKLIDRLSSSSHDSGAS